MIPIIILAIEDDSDRELMIDIYTDLRPLMKATAFQIVKDNGIAEDMVHDTIVKLIDRLDSIRDYERQRLVAYITKAVKNNSLEYCRRKMAEQKHSSFEDAAATAIPEDSPVEAFELSEEYESLGRALKLLPERERMLLHLKYDLGYDDEVSGQIMGINKDSVRQYLTRARRLAKENYLRGDKDE